MIAGKDWASKQWLHHRPANRWQDAAVVLACFLLVAAVAIV